MKTVMNVNKVINKAKLAAIAFVMILTLASSASFAITKEVSSVEFKYIGSTNNQPVFQLNLNNKDEDEFIINLKTATGEVLYSEKISGKQIERKYRLNTDEIDGNTGIHVEVISKNNSNKVVYAVNRTTRIVEDVIVNRL